MCRIRCLLLLTLLVGCGGQDKGLHPSAWEIKQDNRDKSFNLAASAVAFSPDGKQLLVGYSVPAPWQFTYGDNKCLGLWDIDSGQEIRVFKGHTSGVSYAAFLPDGKQAVSASSDGTIRFWEVLKGKEYRQIVPGGETDRAIATVSTDGQTLVSRDKDNSLVFYQTATGNLIGKTEPVPGLLLSLAVSPNATLGLAGGDPGSKDKRNVRVFDVKTMKPTHTLDAHGSWNWSGTFSPDSKYLLTERRIGPYVDRIDLVLWDAATGEEIRTFQRYTADVAAAFFTPDGKYILGAAGHEYLNLWEVATGKEVWYQVFPFNFVALSADGKTAVTASDNRDKWNRLQTPNIRLDLWDVPTGKQLRTLRLREP